MKNYGRPDTNFRVSLPEQEGNPPAYGLDIQGEKACGYCMGTGELSWRVEAGSFTVKRLYEPCYVCEGLGTYHEQDIRAVKQSYKIKFGDWNGTQHT